MPSIFTMQVLKAKLKSLPKNPGVYLFKNTGGEIIYVGKAKNLRNRARSYFSQDHGLQPRTQNLVAAIAELEYIICDTEAEALMLENNLIKKYLPRYNVLLRDDKNYQFIKIDYSTEIPQIYTARKIDGAQRRRPEGAQATAGSHRDTIGSFATLRMTKKSGLQTTNHKLQTSKYFGPYTSGRAVKETLRLMRYIIPYCANKKIGSRPCFYYQLDKCPGVCAGIVSLAEYRQTLARVEKFLKGDFQDILKELKGQMKAASEARLYEKAARLRDSIRALQTMLERQKIVGAKREDFDTVSLFCAGNLAAVNLFQIRAGKLLGRENFLLENAKDESGEEILNAFLERYYLETSDIPPEVDVPNLTPALSQMGEGGRYAPLRYRRGVRGEAGNKKKNSDGAYELWQLEKALFEKSGKRVKFSSPSRGRKRQLIKMGEKNARDYLEKTAQNLSREQAVLTRALFELKEKLKLPDLPLRIECFDISNIQGTSPTGSMVVFENGKPKKSDYKRFAVRSPATPNDVGMMREVLGRRLSHGDRGGNFQFPISLPAGDLPKGDNFQTNSKSKIPISKQESEFWRLPDLIVVDGG
ncbi:MAG: excinuclease ABC subunit UvrC, partial [Patescibacteria group bacterium]